MFFYNIQILCEHHGLELKDLEVDVENDVENNSQKKLTLVSAIKISEKFHVSLDTMTTIDLKKKLRKELLERELAEMEAEVDRKIAELKVKKGL